MKNYTINRLVMTLALLAFFAGGSVARESEKERRRSGLEKRADTYFLRHRYDKAMSLYESLIRREGGTGALHLKVARLYFMVSRYDLAILHYTKVVEKDEDLPTVKDVCDFIDAHRFTGSDQKAEAVCLSYMYKNIFSRHQRYKNVLDVLTKRHNIAAEKSYATTLLPSTGGGTEFLIGELDGKRFLVRSNHGFDPSEKLFFHRIRYYEMEEGHNPLPGAGKASPFHLVPRDLQGGPATFSSRRGLMVSAVLQYETPDQIILGEDNPFKSRLVYSKLDKGGRRYSRFAPLFPQEEGASFTYPFLFRDGLSMFFSSDMPGGYGGFDLYVIHWDEARKAWTRPLNLGPEINTEGDEIAPVLFRDELIFASNGHSGFGGYDLFHVPHAEGTLPAPQHFPHPVNSVFNDFYMYPLDEKSGYIISDRNLGTQNDVYSYQFQGTRLSNNIPYLGDTEQSLMNRWTKPQKASLRLPERLLSLHFDFDKAELTPRAIEQLDEFAGSYGNRTGITLRIFGYTDEAGGEDYNLSLSRRRADIVLEALKNRGVRVPMRAAGRGKIPIFDQVEEEPESARTSTDARRVDIYEEHETH
ncbi:MAG: OmpA family protein [Odoribacteraceae bacterium]|jgi:outer membrane protein OmpA-like peptidoglycan-associated protein/tetratricopeptide (TPR) repeat protein|nr:OmpA family protein [Odoribacteraceae bacterium]